jgi:hypothetical protein
VKPSQIGPKFAITPKYGAVTPRQAVEGHGRRIAINPIAAAIDAKKGKKISECQKRIGFLRMVNQDGSRVFHPGQASRPDDDANRFAEHQCPGHGHGHGHDPDQNQNPKANTPEEAPDPPGTPPHLPGQCTKIHRSEIFYR